MWAGARLIVRGISRVRTTTQTPWEACDPKLHQHVGCVEVARSEDLVAANERTLMSVALIQMRNVSAIPAVELVRQTLPEPVIVSDA